MIRISKRFIERAKPALRKYQRILASARSRDVNESDTVVIVNDFLSDVLGYDKYEEITTEYAVRSTFCDLAIKVGGALRFLIEVKAVGKDLRDNHLRQAVDYSVKEGIDWALLTNGIEWQAHRIRFEKPVGHELLFSIDLLDPGAKPADLLEQLYLLSHEAASGDAMDEFRRHKEATNRFVLAQVVLSDPILKAVRRELRRLSPDIKVTEGEIGDLLKTGVLKRDVLEGDRPKQAASLVKRAMRRRLRRATKERVPVSEPPVAKPPVVEAP